MEGVAGSGGESRAIPYAFVYAISPSFTTAIDTLGAPRAVISCLTMLSMRARMAAGSVAVACAWTTHAGPAISAAVRRTPRRIESDIETPMADCGRTATAMEDIECPPPTRPLFGSQRSRGIDARRAQSGHERRDDRERDEQHGRADHHAWIARRDAEQERADQLAADQRRRDSDRRADPDRARAVREHEIENVPGPGAERDANAHLVRALARAVCHDAVDAESRDD